MTLSINKNLLPPFDVPQGRQAPRNAVATDRLVWTLDVQGRIVSTRWEKIDPAILKARQICLDQGHSLLTTINALVWALQTWEVKYQSNDEREAGYRLALEEIQACDELEKLKAAVGDMRGALAGMIADAGRQS
ncbi:MAG: hypothetical protein M3O30_17530 [Planctomycetota bacterium]|nr:hypothetical protein [Planctomycetota bacterium]